MEHVILVDERDNEVGTMEKMEAHRKGLLHRAFSVVLFNSQGEVLLQKRSQNKYHSAGLWTNTCCSHPKPGEKIEDSVERRLREEMGITAQPGFAYKFIYRADLSNKLVEHELDYVFTGLFSGEPQINSSEVESWKYVGLADVRKDVVKNPDAYTYWFRLMLSHPELKIPVPV
jgi:isopentenyl-diphosphate delta-isomerase